MAFANHSRRLVDIIELMEWAEAIGFDPKEAIKRLSEFSIKWQVRWPYPSYALTRSFPAHAGIQTGSPRSQGRAEVYGLLCNSEAAAQPRKDSHRIESLD
jgi:hypothetical protein